MTGAAADPAPPDGPRTHRHGEWTFTRDGTDLRTLTWRGHEVLRRLFVALRDTSWGTVPARIRELDASRSGALTWRGDFAEAGFPLVVHGLLRLDGSVLTCEITARAVQDVEFNRFGICLLHPLSLAGARTRHRDEDGNWHRAALPELIAPQPLVDGGPSPFLGPFDVLEIQGRQRCRLECEGDLFELEDQRNWTDASFKTYSTPLALPRPQRLRAGERVRQRIRVLMEESPPVPVGALVTQQPGSVDALAELVDFARVEVRAATGQDLRRARHLLLPLLARLPVELVALLEDESDLPRMQSMLEETRGSTHPVLRVLVHAAHGASGTASETTPPALLARAREVLDDGAPPADRMPVGGGTLWNLCELQRHRIDHLEAVCLSVTPTVHAEDRTSILETVEPLPSVLATVRHVAPPGATIHVGPLQHAERTLDSIARGAGGMPPAAGVVPAEWTERTILALAAAGADSICAQDASLLIHDGVPGPHGEAVLRARRALAGGSGPS